MSQLLIKNAYLITMNADREVYETGSILIENNIIKNVGKFDINIVDKDAEIYDAKGKY